MGSESQKGMFMKIYLANPRGFCAGVDRAIEILSDQVRRTMRLLGVTCLEELSPHHVTQLFGGSS